MFVCALLWNLNDAAIAQGGSPRMLDSHPTVRMQSEKIVVTVGKDNTTADCRFVFVNAGPACTVKLGFPDNGDGAADPEEDVDPAERTKPPISGPMTSFKSWVNGTLVKTSLERGQGPGEYWHTKSVTFKAHSSTTVRDIYSLTDSSAIVNMAENGVAAAHFAGYIVHTGASWHGTIGRSEIVFNMPMVVKSVIPYAKATKLVDDVLTFTRTTVPTSTVIYKGMAKPSFSGRQVKFVRTNWNPKKTDDIELWYNFRGPRQPLQSAFQHVTLGAR